jgi:hypothetical protein
MDLVGSDFAGVDDVFGFDDCDACVAGHGAVEVLGCETAVGRYELDIVYSPQSNHLL